MIIDSTELHYSLFPSADDILVFNVCRIEDVESMPGSFASLDDLVQRLTKLRGLHLSNPLQYAARRSLEFSVHKFIIKTSHRGIPPKVRGIGKCRRDQLTLPLEKSVIQMELKHRNAVEVS